MMTATGPKISSFKNAISDRVLVMMIDWTQKALHAISLATKTRRCTLPLGRQNLFKNIKVSYINSRYCQSRKKEVVAHMKLVPRSLGSPAHVLRKGVAGLAGVGETFQELVVDSTCNYPRAIDVDKSAHNIPRCG